LYLRWLVLRYLDLGDIDVFVCRVDTG